METMQTMQIQVFWASYILLKSLLKIKIRYKLYLAKHFFLKNDA
jgi:hypothetical protein